MKGKTIVCFLVGIMLMGCMMGCNNTDNQKESAAETDSVTEVGEETLAQMTQPVYEIPSATAPEPKTFKNMEDAYQYAVSRMNEGKYYLAASCFSSGYKDSKELQLKTFWKINRDDFFYDTVQGKARVADNALQTFSYGYIDNQGYLKMSGSNIPADVKNKVYAPLMELNKKVKFRKIADTLNYAGSYVNVLTMDNKVIRYVFDTKSVVEYAAGSLGEGAFIADITIHNYAVSNLGQLYILRQNGNNINICYLDPVADVGKVVDISNGSWASVTAMASKPNYITVSAGGVILASDKAYEDFPAVRSWDDLICVESSLISVQENYYGYCMGLTSKGEVLFTYEGGKTTFNPFPSGKKYVAITNWEDKIAALTDTGEVYLERVPQWAAMNSGTIQIPMYQNEVKAGGTDKTFASHKDTYEYALKCYNDGRYYEAVKYLRKYRITVERQVLWRRYTDILMAGLLSLILCGVLNRMLYFIILMKR